MDITSWIIFIFKKYIWLDLYISYSNIQEYPTNLKINKIEYICEKINTCYKV